MKERTRVPSVTTAPLFRTPALPPSPSQLHDIDNMLKQAKKLTQILEANVSGLISLGRLVSNRPHGYSVTAHPCYGAVGTHPTGGNIIKFNVLKITRQVLFIYLCLHSGRLHVKNMIINRDLFN